MGSGGLEGAHRRTAFDLQLSRAQPREWLWLLIGLGKKSRFFTAMLFTGNLPIIYLGHLIIGRQVWSASYRCGTQPADTK